MYLSIIKFETRFASLKMNARDAERSALRSYMSGLTSIAFGDLRLSWIQIRSDKALITCLNLN